MPLYGHVSVVDTFMFIVSVSIAFSWRVIEPKSIDKQLLELFINPICSVHSQHSSTFQVTPFMLTVDPLKYVTTNVSLSTYWIIMGVFSAGVAKPSWPWIDFEWLLCNSNSRRTSRTWFSGRRTKKSTALSIGLPVPGLLPEHVPVPKWTNLKALWLLTPASGSPPSAEVTHGCAYLSQETAGEHTADTGSVSQWHGLFIAVDIVRLRGKWAVNAEHYNLTRMRCH